MVSSSKLIRVADYRWSDQICGEILELVIQKLQLVDRLKFKAVCKTWRRVMMQRHLSPLPELPWLMFSSDPSTDSFNLLNLFGENRVYKMKISEVCRSWCYGSQESWLVMADEKRGNFMLNPFSRAFVQLPPQATIPHSAAFREDVMNPQFIRKAIFSSAPTPGSSCLVVAIDGFGNLYYCRPGDGSWSALESGLKQSIYDDIIFYEGQLHAITYDEKLKIFSSVGPNSKVILHEKLLPVGDNSQNIPSGYRRSDTNYLVESDHKLLMVRQTVKTYREEAFKGKYLFRVYEVDIHGKHLFPLTSLGDEMLFLGKNYSMSLKATSGYYSGAGRNCIFFTDKYTSGVYRLEDQSTDSSFQHNSLSTEIPAIWITPDPLLDRVVNQP